MPVELLTHTTTEPRQAFDVITPYPESNPGGSRELTVAQHVGTTAFSNLAVRTSTDPLLMRHQQPRPQPPPPPGPKPGPHDPGE